MQIENVKPNKPVDDLIVEIKDFDEEREVMAKGKKSRVVNAKVGDETGELDMSLWNEEIDKVKVGDKIKIMKGFCFEFQNKPILGTGTFGSLEVL